MNFLAKLCQTMMLNHVYGTQNVSGTEWPFMC